MDPTKPAQKDKKQYFLNITLAVVAGQAGCLTLVVILLAVFVGLWIDNQFQTRPIFTLITVIGSVPISLALMFLVVRAAMSKINIQTSESRQDIIKEDTEVGRKD